MHPSYLIGITLVLLLLIVKQQRNEQYWVVQMQRRKRGKSTMLELANNFIGKECLVYTFNGSELEGTVQEVVGNALLMVVKSELQAINLDFVVRIREYPRKKSGKKKSIVID